ncbi:MAG: AI-2E family transporter [Chloroflexi bacterium]|nr:AI-2E family transporter [Chloroflexota bacterium]
MTPSPFNTRRLLFLLVGVVVVAFLIYYLRNALLPFIIGLALAYILDPVVSWMDRHIPVMNSRPETKRIILILFTFAAAIIVFIGALIAIIPAIVAEIRHFVDILPSLIQSARGTVQNLDEQISAQLPEEVVVVIHDAAQDIGGLVISAAGAFAARTYGVVSQTMSLMLGLAMVPLVLFYVLKDRGKILDGMLNTLQPTPRMHTVRVLFLLNDIFSAYVRGQLILGVVVGAFVFLGLWGLGVPFAPVLGLVAGVFELVPVIGPWLGAIPGVLVVLATEPEKFIWVALLYLIVQLLENSLLVPRIQGESLNLHPVMVLAALLVGSELAGFWGIILGPPLAAAARSVLLYFLSVWRTEVEDRVAETQPVDVPDEAPPSEFSEEAAPSGEPAGD